MRSQAGAFPSKRQLQPLIPLDVQDVEGHVAAAAAIQHPTAAADAELSLDALDAIEWVAATYGRGGAELIQRERGKQVAFVNALKRDLVSANQDLERYVSEHVKAMPQRIDIALLHVLSQAAGCPDSDLAVGFAIGFPAIGDVPPSGWWAPETPDDQRGHAMPNVPWQNVAEQKAVADAASEEHAEVWSRTMREVKRNLIRGPFTRDDMDAAYGRGRYRPMVRFGVLQKGKVRPCDNARASATNAETILHEKLLCDTPDFSARVAVAFWHQAQLRGLPMWRLAGGTDDLADAYRHVPSDDPRATCVVLAHPETKVPLYFTLPGFNFGLKSAVMQFNRFPEATTAIARRLLGVVCTHFYDDFAVVEPSETARGAQRALRKLHTLLGFPFSTEKEVDAEEVFTFLGVVSDLSSADQGVATLRISEQRIASLTQRFGEILASGLYPSAQAASLCGKLQFVLSWASGKLGRACMQPLFKPQGDVVSPPVAASLRFLAGMLPRIPPHDVALACARTRPTLIFSDGASEQYGTVQTVGFVIASPRPDAPPLVDGEPPSIEVLAMYYDLIHGSADVPADLRAAFVTRTQQIGVVEIVGALIPYLSASAVLAGRNVIHWIDNTSALAALTKGYSGLPDSARLVHVFHAWATATGTAVWFEYVPSAANVADLPSRDMTLAHRTMQISSELISHPCPVRFPPAHALDDVQGWLGAELDILDLVR